MIGWASLSKSWCSPGKRICSKRSGDKNADSWIRLQNVTEIRSCSSGRVGRQTFQITRVSSNEWMNFAVDYKDIHRGWSLAVSFSFHLPNDCSSTFAMWYNWQIKNKTYDQSATFFSERISRSAGFTLQCISRGTPLKSGTTKRGVTHFLIENQRVFLGFPFSLNSHALSAVVL